MATRKKQPVEPVRNEQPLPDIENSFPRSDAYAPRAWGAAGVRIEVERALRGLHGFGDELWEALGISKRELAARRGEIVATMRRVVGNPERGFATNRTAAVALLGELGGADVMPDLRAVLSSPFERGTTRSWAAVALGRCGKARAVEPLRAALADPDPLVRRGAVDGLAVTRSREAVAALAAAVKTEKDPVIANRAFDRVRQLEKTLALEPLRLRRPALPKGGGTTVPAG
jgi:hypothetical protein